VTREGPQSRSRQGARRRAALALLEPLQANVALDSAERVAHRDSRVVSHARLEAVSDAALKELFAADDPERGYLHPESLRNAGPLVNRLRDGS
jgi:hypothetical protein